MQYKISGIVIKGDGYGRKIGFPTVNLQTDTKNLPPLGVYTGNAVLDGKNYRAGIVIGPGDKVEGHLIGYNSDAYDKEVILNVEKFLREFKNFKNEEELIVQIKKDIKICSQA